MAANLLDISWFMKYQPKNISDYIFEDNATKSVVENWLKQEYIDGNILLSGPPGTGKTALAELLIQNIIKSKPDLKRIRSRSVNEIDELYTWIQKSPLKSKKKIVYLEEFDKLSPQAQTTLKDTLLEKFQNNISFICTTNYINKIDKALISRFNHRFELIGNNVDGIVSRLKQILEKENIQFNEETLKEYVKNNNKQGLRNLITNIQINTVNNIIDFSHIHNQISPIEERISELTREILKIIFGTKDIVKKRQILGTPLTSDIGKEYAELIEILQFQKDIHYDSVYLILNDKIQFLPIKLLISKYIESSEYKKLQYLHYIAFLYESIKSVLDINLC